MVQSPGAHSPAPLWLTRESEVVSHLFYAAAEIGAAVVELAGQPVEGVLAMPDPKTGTFAFFVAEGQALRAPPEAGAVVRVRYVQGNANYAFLTVLAELTGPRRWELRFPRSVERNERRAAERRRVSGRAGISLQQLAPTARVIALYDLSVSGVGLIVSRADRTMRPGNKISGLLRLPGGADLDLRLEIRHSRPLPGDREAVIVGCRALGLSPADEAALKTTLEGLRDIAD